MEPRGPRWFWRTLLAWAGVYLALLYFLGRAGHWVAAWALGVLLFVPATYILQRGRAVDQREGIVRDTEAWANRGRIRMGFVMLGALLAGGFVLIGITIVMVVSD
jgi:hypothetical protein